MGRFASILAFASLAAACSRAEPPLARSASRPVESVPPAADPSTVPLPKPSHVVVVIEENRSFDQIVGNGDAPYMNSLEEQGALFTSAHGEAHPSQPNYLALFSGSTHGVRDNKPFDRIDAPNLGRQLLDAGLSFVGYSESQPNVGFQGAEHGPYKRKHNPWAAFSNLPPEVNRPLADFPADFSALPTVAFVVPDVDHDMHDGSIGQADQWLAAHVDPYVRWARTHDALLVLTWDEDDGTPENRIPTVFFGPMVQAGRRDERIDHLSILRTIEAMYGLPPIAGAAREKPISDCWIAAR